MDVFNMVLSQDLIRTRRLARLMHPPVQFYAETAASSWPLSHCWIGIGMLTWWAGIRRMFRHRAN